MSWSLFSKPPQQTSHRLQTVFRVLCILSTFPQQCLARVYSTIWLSRGRTFLAQNVSYLACREQTRSSTVDIRSITYIQPDTNYGCSPFIFEFLARQFFPSNINGLDVIQEVFDIVLSVMEYRDNNGKAELKGSPKTNPELYRKLMDSKLSEKPQSCRYNGMDWHRRLPQIIISFHQSAKSKN